MKENIEEQEKKKLSILNILLIFLMVVVTLVGVFFLSTYIRWEHDIENKNEILYYKQNDIKIDSLKDFYDNDISLDIEDTEALRMYCSNTYGGDCITGDFSNTLENLFRDPYIVVNIVVIIDLLLFYILIRNNNIKLVYVYAIAGIILVYGFFGIGRQIYKYADYYKLVNDTEYIVDGQIYKGIMTENTKEFKPVVLYNTDKGEFVKYLDYDIEGTINDKVNEKITLYYDKKYNEIVTPKRTLNGYVKYIILGIFTIIESILYFVKAKKLKKKENS